jgi:hypothetical protein
LPEISAASTAVIVSEPLVARFWPNRIRSASASSPGADLDRAMDDDRRRRAG